MRRTRVFSLLAFLLTMLIVPVRADESVTPVEGTELANANTVALLAAAREALAAADRPASADDPGAVRRALSAAADSLTQLYQLHGCEWAMPELRRLYARPDMPPLRLGFSPDGRVLLRVEPLELQNPAYANYTILLCTFTSYTARGYRDAAQGTLAVALPDGTFVPVEAVTEAHPLWPQLSKMAKQFAPPQKLPSGAGVAWKQLLAVPSANLPLNACALSLDWGGYRFDLPRWSGEASDG